MIVDDECRWHRPDEMASTASATTAEAPVRDAEAPVREIPTELDLPPQPAAALKTSIVVRLLLAEALERFCYHGISAVYVLYMQEMLAYSTSAISAVTSVFNFLAYGVGLLGGFIGDRHLGRKDTLLTFGWIFFFGLGMLSISASPLGFEQFPLNPTWAPVGLAIGLLLSASGSSGIQSNAAPFALDQYQNPTKLQSERVSQYYFWSNSVGAVMGMLIAPLMRRIEIGGLTYRQAQTDAGTANASVSDGCPPLDSSDGSEIGNESLLHTMHLVFKKCNPPISFTSLKITVTQDGSATNGPAHPESSNYVRAYLNMIAYLTIVIHACKKSLPSEAFRLLATHLSGN